MSGPRVLPAHELMVYLAAGRGTGRRLGHPPDQAAIDGLRASYPQDAMVDIIHIIATINGEDHLTKGQLRRAEDARRRHGTRRGRHRFGSSEDGSCYRASTVAAAHWRILELGTSNRLVRTRDR